MAKLRDVLVENKKTKEKKRKQVDKQTKDVHNIHKNLCIHIDDGEGDGMKKDNNKYYQKGKKAHRQ